VSTLPERTLASDKRPDEHHSLERAPSAAVRHISSDDEMPLTIMNEGLSATDPACTTPGQSKKQTEMLTALMDIIPEPDSIPAAKNP
jgi:hypothetical protein